MRTESIHDLVYDGDWACSHGAPDRLAAVALTLGDVLFGQEAELAQAIARQAWREFPAATASWQRLGALLSARGALSPWQGWKSRESSAWTS